MSERFVSYDRWLALQHYPDGDPDLIDEILWPMFFWTKLREAGTETNLEAEE